MEFNNNIEDILKNNKIRITQQRLLLLDTLVRSKHPFSASDFNLEQISGINLVTVYRFLSLLAEKKIIRSVGDFNGKEYFEYSLNQASHPHFYCTKCHMLCCLNYLSADDYVSLCKYAPNTETEEIKIIIGGVCEKCRH